MKKKLILSVALLLLLTACSPEKNAFSAPTDPIAPITSTAAPDKKIKTKTLSESSLGTLTASVEIENPIKSPYPYETGDEYWGLRLILRITDENGKNAVCSLPDTLKEEYDGGPIEYGIKAECGDSAPQIFEADKDGEKRYIIMQYVSYDSKTGLHRAAFFPGDLDRFGEDAELRWYDLTVPPGRTFSSIEVSDSFEYIGGTSFADEKLGFTIDFDTTAVRAWIYYSENADESNDIM